MKKILLGGTVLLTGIIAGCATAPQNIAPTYVSELSFQHLGCQHIYAERQRTIQALATASHTQSLARSNDTLGVLLIGLPVSTLSGSNQAAYIANLKGTIDALGNMGARKGCF